MLNWYKICNQADNYRGWHYNAPLISSEQQYIITIFTIKGLSNTCPASSPHAALEDFIRGPQKGEKLADCSDAVLAALTIISHQLIIMDGSHSREAVATARHVHLS